MSNPNSRPPSDFYADINDPGFPGGFFDTYYPLIKDYDDTYRGLAADGRLALQHLAGQDIETALEGGFDWMASDGFAMDHILQLSGEEATFMLIDHGTGTRQALARADSLDPHDPRRLRGSGVDAESLVAGFRQEHDDTHFLVNSDGVILADPYDASLADAEFHGLDLDDPAADLLESGMSMAFIAELVFDKKNQPSTSSDMQHEQFGVITTKGFVPFFTRLGIHHEAVRQYHQQLDPKIIKAAAQKKNAEQ